MTFPATPKIAIIGLGYVGLPLAAHLANGFGKKYPVTGSHCRHAVQYLA